MLHYCTSIIEDISVCLGTVETVAH